MRHPRVVVAPDKFKGSLTAAEVAAAVGEGLSGARPGLEVRPLPVADGGEGTLAAAQAAGFTLVPVEVRGPTGVPVTTAFASRDGTAVVEMADACGLARLPGGRPAPLAASSHGLGDVIVAALDVGADRLVVGIGGSASTDGGAGLVAALGGRLLDTDGADLRPGGASLARLAHLDLDRLHPRLSEVELLVACDVDNPLTGRTGAAAVYGPQKGATPADVELLDEALTRWADEVAAHTGHDRRDEPGAGAAGGVGFAAVALLGATLRPGIELMLDLVGFGDALTGADLVVTGEGSLDTQSLHGKAPVGVAAAARAAGVRTVAVCGRLDVAPTELRAAGIAAAYALTELEPDPDICMRDAAPLLRRLAARVAGDHLPLS